jgi:MFS family permease
VFASLSFMKERMALLVIAAAFVLASVYPFLKAEPEVAVDVCQIRKLLEYGFVERQGAILTPQVTTGKLVHPENFNYTHHPLPRYWLCAGVYHFWGANGVALLTTLVGLLESLLVYSALRRHFDFTPALVAALLYACAPAFQFYAVGATSGIFMWLLWPIATLLIPLSNDDARPWPGRGLWLGLTVFLTGQASWFMLSAVPSLLLMSAVTGADWQNTIRRNLRNRLWWAILLGAALSLLVFVAQVIHYTPSLHEPFEYVAYLASSGQSGFAKTRTGMLLTLSLRTVVLLGPALLAGLLMGIYAASRRKRLTRGAMAMMVYALLWGLGALFLTFLFNREKWLFTWLLFPAAYLTAGWLSTAKTRAMAWALLALAVPGVVYVQWTASLPGPSQASSRFASYLIQHTEPEDLILTNLKPQTFPFPYWDVSGCDNIKARADRLLFYSITSAGKLDDPRKLLRGQVARTLFLRESAGEIGSDLAQQLRDHGHLLERAELPVPAEVETFGLRLRSFYWKLQGKTTGLENGVANLTNRVVRLELYRLD